MVIVKANREQWRTIESLAAKCREVSRFTRETSAAHGAFRGVSRDSAKSSSRIDTDEVRALLSAARHACAELAQRPRFLENPQFIMLRDVGCILSAALDCAGFVSDCH